MITIIAGSRTITNEDIVGEAVKASGVRVTEVVEGGQRTWCGSHIVGGVDWLARVWGLKNKLPVKTINAPWELHGKAAGPIRNRQMAEYADALIAIWDGESRGTKNMIEEAERRGLEVYVYRV